MIPMTTSQRWTTWLNDTPQLVPFVNLAFFVLNFSINDRIYFPSCSDSFIHHMHGTTHESDQRMDGTKVTLSFKHLNVGDCSHIMVAPAAIITPPTYQLLPRHHVYSAHSGTLCPDFFTGLSRVFPNLMLRIKFDRWFTNE